MKPIKELLDTTPDERVVRRTWDAIDARLHRRSPRRYVFAGLAAAACALLVFVKLRGGADTALDIPLDLTGTTTLADGSEIAVARGHLELIESSPKAVRMLAPDGDARFSITPGGPRKWTIDAGLVQVEVVGTIFRVARDASGVTVSVERGIVVVRGEHVPGLSQRLVAGGALHVAAEKTAVVAPVPVPAPTPPVVAVDPPPVVAPPHPVAKPPTSAELLARADALRAKGDLAGAVVVLDAIGSTPGDPLAGMARFTRARVLVDLGRRAEAATDFERAIAAGLPAALEAKARARLAELRP